MTFWRMMLLRQRIAKSMETSLHLRCNDCFLTLKVPSMSTINKRKKYFIPNFEARSVLLVATLTFAGIAGAQGQTSSPAPARDAPAATGSVPANKATSTDVNAAFDRADADKDGKLSRTEAENLPAVAQRFEQSDTDRDTFVSREELMKFAGS